MKLITANKGRRGFTYTHHLMSIAGNKSCVKVMNESGFVVNLSADTLADADRLADLDVGPVVVLLPSDATENTVTPAGRKVVVCPATKNNKIRVNCATCQLCARSDRKTIIGFPAHGTMKSKATAIAMGG